MDFVASFSGGKDSTLSIIDMVKKGHRLVAILVAIQGKSSWVHQIDKSYFDRFADIFACQIIYIDSSKDDYDSEFVRGLTEAKSIGADVCIFGDINILDHVRWNESVSNKAGIIAYHPLLNRTSRSVVSEILELGIKSSIIKVRKDIDKIYIGSNIDKDFIGEFSSRYPDFDICGEKGEYHTRVDLDSLEDIISKIPCGGDLYFDNASTCFPKAPGVAGICSRFISDRSYSINRGTFRGAYDLSSDIIDHREDVLDLFGADKKSYECVFTNSATISINTILFGSLKRGDHIILDDKLHNSTWRVVNKLRADGVEVGYWKMKDNKYRIDDFRTLLRENTRMVFLTMVDNIAGAYIVDDIDDYGAFVSLVRENDIVYAGDGVQLAIEREFSVDELGLDIFVATSHIGMMATEGLSYLIGKKEVLESIEPLVYGGTGSQSNLETMPETLPDKFEVGSINTTAIFSAIRSISYIRSRGVASIIEKKHRLAEHLRQGIKNIDGVRVIGDGSFCLVLADKDSKIDMSVLMFMLDYQYNIKARVGVQCSKMANDHYESYPGGIRFSMGYFNTDRQVDYLIESIKSAIKSC
ncbi:aminotransferase class V-fold PLP-dependent enzyme [Peptostreptococcus anaerobius]|uniref:aminotransferase class V-fold PLP-dependent enzyme n=1 Tax=Peptostreptococcus anaerobius TaxID=1261 RepID=UPI001D0995F1|nr:aminotransferase class V-fold PLP-dependent enzyme [Peptostreptococcus anaerobius]MCB6983240.1 aminotransferase class V-fold PLP-dependent enzyme [Peptostreptococcus anaerobius]MCQ5151101.1 aminotransferase class V-fold PLP-dependent enzyme [Peptostreptococcus anaerobius]